MRLCLVVDVGLLPRVHLVGGVRLSRAGLQALQLLKPRDEATGIVGPARIRQFECIAVSEARERVRQVLDPRHLDPFDSRWHDPHIVVLRGPLERRLDLYPDEIVGIVEPPAALRIRDG